jgi:dTDP-4-amino-4,6-dideoxygalactose transaminase
LHQQAPFAVNFFLTDNHAAGNIYESSLSLPCSTSITNSQLAAVADAVKAFYRN